MPMKPGTTKNLLLRLDPTLARRLEVVAVVAGRTLELDTDRVLDLLDPTAAEAALARARSGAADDEPARQAAALLHALVDQRPLRRGNQQVALVATLQFLALTTAGTSTPTRRRRPGPWSPSWPPARSTPTTSWPGLHPDCDGANVPRPARRRHRCGDGCHWRKSSRW